MCIGLPLLGPDSWEANHRLEGITPNLALVHLLQSKEQMSRNEVDSLWTRGKTHILKCKRKMLNRNRNETHTAHDSNAGP